MLKLTVVYNIFSDYGFYRPDGKDNCIVQPNFNLPEIDICKQGREEKFITKG